MEMVHAVAHILALTLEKLKTVEEVVGEGVSEARGGLLAAVSDEGRAHALQEMQSILAKTLDEVLKVLETILVHILGHHGGRGHGQQTEKDNERG